MGCLSPTLSSVGCLVDYLSKWLGSLPLAASFYGRFPQVLGCLSFVKLIENHLVERYKILLYLGDIVL